MKGKCDILMSIYAIYFCALFSTYIPFPKRLLRHPFGLFILARKDFLRPRPWTLLKSFRNPITPHPSITSPQVSQLIVLSVFALHYGAVIPIKLFLEKTHKRGKSREDS